ncbi:phage portal protein [Tateyamaria sp. syn59]|uniref:phage portal protein n=1 Tax=Tateyamaria sp. syn59 TaxID=2576942 RepID=UPI0011BD8E01|nr:phage portal protein [Tateyamaria sp. syn59]
MILKAVSRGLHSVANLMSGESGWIDATNAEPLSQYGTTSKAGTVVSGETAMCLSAVWDAVRKTSGVIGSTPLAQFQRDDSGNPSPVEDDLHSILTLQPAPGITPSQFWTGQVVQMLLRGNAYNERLEVGRNRRLVGLRPMFNVTPKRQADGTFRYQIIDRGKRYEMPADKVFHLRGFGAGDGLGMSAIKYGTQSIGAAIAADQSAATVFANSMMVAGVLSSDSALTAEQRAQLQELLEQFIGSSKAGKTLVLESGLKWDAVQLNPEDAQLLETRRFSVEDVCRWFGVPPVVIGHTSSGQTMFGAGVEQVMLSWQKLGIGPLYRAIEDQIRMDLIAPQHRARRSFRFDRQWMLAMDSAALGDFLLKLRMGGYISGDEGRSEWLGMSRRGGDADDLIVSSAMSPVDMLGKEKT